MSTADPLGLIGQTVAEKYLVEVLVGSGGFAHVYRAKHLAWGRAVALKVYNGLFSVGAADREKLGQAFAREGSLLADLSQRTAAICQAHDVGTLILRSGERVPYMVLEWLDGASLAHVLEVEAALGQPPRTMQEAVRLIEPVAGALALAHRRGIAHRDVKPANVFVLGDPHASDCVVKLLDFGIAKVVADAWDAPGALSKTTTQIAAFTPHYGAPEQFSRRHGATGPWTDVFALALVLVQMVTRKAPLRGETFADLSLASADLQARPTPRALGAHVSDEVEAVMRRALAVYPEERWPTAGEFWTALREALRLGPLPDVTGPHALPSRGQMAVMLARTIAAEGSLPSISSSHHPPPARRRVSALGVAGAIGILVIATVGMVRREPTDTDTAVAAAPADPPPIGASPTASCAADMIAIPGGSFFMGADEGTPMERPAHKIRLDPFCIDRTEVTVAKYKTCSDAGGCKRASQTNEWDTISAAEHEAFDPLCNARDPRGRATHPINCVDWEMASAFCREQGKRLPTEAEWELAARGRDGRKYPWGDEEPSAALLNACGAECVAWGKKNGIPESAMYAADDGWPTTAPVGSFPKGSSPYGVEDVVGNVWEWVADWFGDYGSEEQKNPAGPNKGIDKVIRGGAWNGAMPSWVQPTYRFKGEPARRSYAIGFRCAM